MFSPGFFQVPSFSPGFFQVASTSLHAHLVSLAPPDLRKELLALSRRREQVDIISVKAEYCFQYKTIPIKGSTPFPGDQGHCLPGRHLNLLLHGQVKSLNLDSDFDKDLHICMYIYFPKICIYIKS